MVSNWNGGKLKAKDVEVDPLSLSIVCSILTGPNGDNL